MASIGSEYIGNAKYSDLILLCDGREWPAHKLVVCSKSAWLDAACTAAPDDGAKTVVHINECDAVTLSRVLQYLYKNDYSDDDDSTIILPPLIHSLLTAPPSLPLLEGPRSIENDTETQSLLIDLNREESHADKISQVCTDMQAFDLKPPAPFGSADISKAWAHVRVHSISHILEILDLSAHSMARLSERIVGAWNSDGFVEFVRTTFDLVGHETFGSGPCHLLASECASHIVALMGKVNFNRLVEQKPRLAYLIVMALVDRLQKFANGQVEQLSALLPSDWLDILRSSLGENVETGSAPRYSGTSTGLYNAASPTQQNDSQSIYIPDLKGIETVEDLKDSLFSAEDCRKITKVTKTSKGLWIVQFDSSEVMHEVLQRSPKQGNFSGLKLFAFLQRPPWKGGSTDTPEKSREGSTGAASENVSVQDVVHRQALQLTAHQKDIERLKAEHTEKNAEIANLRRRLIDLKPASSLSDVTPIKRKGRGTFTVEYNNEGSGSNLGGDAPASAVMHDLQEKDRQIAELNTKLEAITKEKEKEIRCLEHDLAEQEDLIRGIKGEARPLDNDQSVSTGSTNSAVADQLREEQKKTRTISAQLDALIKELNINNGGKNTFSTNLMVQLNEQKDLVADLRQQLLVKNNATKPVPQRDDQKIIIDKMANSLVEKDLALSAAKQASEQGKKKMKELSSQVDKLARDKKTLSEDKEQLSAKISKLVAEMKQKPLVSSAQGFSIKGHAVAHANSTVSDTPPALSIDPHLHTPVHPVSSQIGPVSNTSPLRHPNAPSRKITQHNSTPSSQGPMTFFERQQAEAKQNSFKTNGHVDRSVASANLPIPTGPRGSSGSSVLTKAAGNMQAFRPEQGAASEIHSEPLKHESLSTNINSTIDKGQEGMEALRKAKTENEALKLDLAKAGKDMAFLKQEMSRLRLSDAGQSAMHRRPGPGPLGPSRHSDQGPDERLLDRPETMAGPRSPIEFRPGLLAHGTSTTTKNIGTLNPNKNEEISGKVEQVQVAEFRPGATLFLSRAMAGKYMAVAGSHGIDYHGSVMHW